ncbi:MAG: polyprenol monophosphomannose synthase [Chloroflexi bacterium]|nr:polyprenol monophosphomannose synthase [Chloroflexota bacterium]
MNVWIVLPTYNEAENLEAMVETLLDKLDWMAGSSPPSPKLVPEAVGVSSSTSLLRARPPAPRGWLEVPPNVSVLVVDDASPDGTGRIADRLSRERDGRVRVLHRAGKLGLGSAYIAGFSLALEWGADIVFEMDADFSHSPSYLPEMLRLLENHDVVVGSRWAPGGKLDERWEMWRYLLSKYANLYARWVTGLRVYDTTAGFKAWRGDALRKLPLHRVRSDGYAFQIEMAVASQQLKLRVTELPIYFGERERGQSKMSWRIITEATWRVWQIRSRW